MGLVLILVALVVFIVLATTRFKLHPFLALLVLRLRLRDPQLAQECSGGADENFRYCHECGVGHRLVCFTYLCPAHAGPDCGRG